MKKITRLFSLILIATMVLTGCSMPFGSKDEEIANTPTTDIVDTSTYVNVTDVVTYELGQTVKFEDVITYTETATTVSQFGFIFDDGTVSTELPTNTIGDNSVEVIIEFIDGVYQSTYSYTVAEPKVTVPDSIMSVLKDDSTYREILSIDGVDAVVFLKDSEVNSITETIMQYDELESVFNIDLYVTTTRSQIEYGGIIDPTPSSVVEVILENAMIDEEYDYSKVIDSLSDYVIIDTNREPEDTSIVVYDTDGNTHPLKKYTYSVDYSQITTNPLDKYVVVLGYGFDYNGVEYYIVSRTRNVSSIPTNNTSSQEYVDLSEVIKGEYSEENYGAELLAAINEKITTDNLSVKMRVLNSVQHSNMLKNYVENNDCVIIGNYNELVGTTETPSEETVVTDEPATTDEPVVTEEPIEIVDIEGSYERMFPQIFKYPAKDTKFRRWTYTIDKGSFAGTIVNPDGSYEEGEGSWDFMGSNESNRNNDENDNVQTFTLTSGYKSYLISSSNFPDVTFVTSDSTASRLDLWYGDTKYHIVLARATQINNYLTNCLYDTADMRDAKFTVKKSGEGVSADYGTITTYNISFTNTVGKNKVHPYMAVYDLDDDYIVVYSDNLIADGSTAFYEMLSKMVVEY